jgi:hypothetical protein
MMPIMITTRKLPKETNSRINSAPSHWPRIGCQRWTAVIEECTRVMTADVSVALLYGAVTVRPAVRPALGAPPTNVRPYRQ